MALHDDIQAEAKSLGFSLTGITLPQSPPHFNVYEDWLAAGRHGSMAYLAAAEARQKRAQPLHILPEARSILLTGMHYPSPAQLPETDPSDGLPTGRVAAYAWGADYHDVIPLRLNELADRLSKITGSPLSRRAYTDTGPILERDLGQQAGLGWAGKNTCLINPQAGSYFFLGELLSDVELEPTPPFQADLCGSCTRCIDACPTDCILPDRTIDAVRCISYQTIENKGPIPLDLREKIGSWVFGCDICQQVCPWNLRFASDQIDPVFQPIPEIQQPVLTQELSLTPQDFNRKFRSSPVRRAKRRGYLRNITVALGNRANRSSPDTVAVQALIRVLNEEFEPLVRAHAAWALGKSNAPAALAALEKALSREVDPIILEEIHYAIQQF